MVLICDYPALIFTPAYSIINIIAKSMHSHITMILQIAVTDREM